MEQAAFRNKVIVKALASPAVWVPAVVGGALLVVAAVAGGLTGAAGIAGVAAVGLAVAVAAKRLFLDTQALAAEVVRDGRDARLNAVERRLRKTRDVRTFRAIKLLREQRHRLLDAADSGRFPVPPDAVAASESLYRSCVDSLERSAKLWEASRQMSTREARDELKAKRRALVDEVRQSVEQWARTIDRLQAAPLTREAQADDDHTRARRELDAQLAVARRVEERMQALEREVAGRE